MTECLDRQVFGRTLITNRKREVSLNSTSEFHTPQPSSNQDLCQQRNRKLRQRGAPHNFFTEMKLRVNEVELNQFLQTPISGNG